MQEDWLYTEKWHHSQQDKGWRLKTLLGAVAEVVDAVLLSVLFLLVPLPRELPGMKEKKTG